MEPKITEKEFCEYCSKTPNNNCNICKYYKTCMYFMVENEGATPDYYTFDGVYTGKSPNRIWEIIDNIEEKKKETIAVGGASI